VTLREVEPAAARAWMLRTLGLRDESEFDPAALPREPTRFEGAVSPP
jgi:hypothetical protein